MPKHIHLLTLSNRYCTDYYLLLFFTLTTHTICTKTIKFLFKIPLPPEDVLLQVMVGN